MSLSISIPDDVAAMLGSSPQEREQRAREAIALELYRQGKISLRVMGTPDGVYNCLKNGGLVVSLQR